MREHFSTDDVPPRDRAQFGLDLLAQKIARLTLGGRLDLATFRAALDVSVVGRFTTFHFETSHLNWRRTPADLRVGSSDMYSLLRAPRERAYVAYPMRSNKVEIRLGAGDFCISSNMWPYESAEKGSFSVGGLLIPHRLLSPLSLKPSKCGQKRYPAGTNTSTNARLTEAEIHAVSMACRTAVGSHI
jgi:hypothetical protein